MGDDRDEVYVCVCVQQRMMKLPWLVDTWSGENVKWFMGTLSDLTVANRLLLYTRSLKTLHTAHSPIHTALFCSFSTSKSCSVNHSLWRTPREQLCIFPKELLASKRARSMIDQTSLRVLQTNQVSRNYNVMLILSPASSLPPQFSCYVFDAMLFWKFCSCSCFYVA